MFSFSSRFFVSISFPFSFRFGISIFLFNVRAITWGGTHDVAVFTVTYCVIKTSLTVDSTLAVASTLAVSSLAVGITAFTIRMGGDYNFAIVVWHFLYIM